MNEKIGMIIDLFKKEKDLEDQVLRFFAPTLVKLNLLFDKMKNKELLLEEEIKLEQILDKYIPSLIQDYTRLPFNSRNQDIIRNNKTAKELLIDSLNNISSQTEELLESVLEKDKTQFLANNRKLNTIHQAQEAELEVEVEKDFNMDNEVEKLLSQAQGTWETAFKRPGYHPEVNKKDMLTPTRLFLVTVVIVLVLVVLL